MNKNHDQDLLREVDRLTFIFAGLFILVLIGSYFFLISLNNIPATILNFLSGILTNLISILLVFIISYAIFRHIQKIKSEQEAEHLTQMIAELINEKPRIIERIHEELASKSDDVHRLYTCYGLLEDARTEHIFQDFEISREDGYNVNAVQYLWADTFKGSEINACVMNHDSPFLRITFSNDADCFPCNIAIRPRRDRALSNLFKMQYLTFEARIPQEALANNNHLDEVHLAIRVANGHLEHWEYSIRPSEYRTQKVHTDRWQKYKIDLSERRNWSLFTADGNHIEGPKEVNFAIIALVIFEMGSYRTSRPGSGSGVVDIRQIKLEES